jgi:hypothetical protein
MPGLVPIKVVCHSGYKTDEYPTRFYLGQREYEISDVIDRWYQGERDPTVPVANYFKVQTRNGAEFIIKHEMANDAWYLLT